MTITPLNLALRQNSSTALSWLQEDANFSAIQTAVNTLISTGSGQMTVEGPFISGTGFTPGVTTTLTLSQSYVSVGNVSVHFDGIFQGYDTYSILGTSIIFNNAIPVGVQEVYIVGGATLPINTPAAASVGLAAFTPAALAYFANPNNIAYRQGSAGSATISQQYKNQQTVNILDFYANGVSGALVDPTGAIDSTAGVQAALNTGKVAVDTSGGTFLISATLTVPANGGFIGAGQTLFLRNFTGGRLFSYLGGNPIVLRSFQINTASGITVANGDTGIDLGWSTPWLGQGEIRNIIIQNQWDGIKWTGGTFNVIDNIQCILNRGHGFYMVNARGPISNCLAQYNFGDGYHYYMAAAGETGIQMTACGTFANKGYGFWFGAYTGGASANVWMTGCSSSTDGAGGIVFAQQYYQIWLSQILIESAGTAYIPFNANNPTLTPWVANLTAPGLSMQNPIDVWISDIFIHNNNGNGAYFDGVSYATFNNWVVHQNGQGAAGASNQTGITFSGATVTNTNITFSNLIANYGANQTIDISFATTNNTSIIFASTSFRTFYNAGASPIFTDTAVTTASNIVASASTLTLLPYTNFNQVSGTTTINSIAASWQGRQVSLKFTSAGCGVVNGNNLYLSAAYTSTVDGVLSLISDGANWYEVSRSTDR